MKCDVARSQAPLPWPKEWRPCNAALVKQCHQIGLSTRQWRPFYGSEGQRVVRSLSEQRVDRLSALSPEGLLVLPSSCVPAEGDLGSSRLWDRGL